MDQPPTSGENFDLPAYLRDLSLPKQYHSEEQLVTILCEGMNSVRKHLDMDIAFLSEFVEGKRVFRFVESADKPTVIDVDASDPLEETYCQRIVDGRFPELIPDVTKFEPARRLKVTEKLGIGSYMGVPVAFSDGSVYGTFCCFGSESAGPLPEKHIAVVRGFAALAGNILEVLSDRRRRLRILAGKLRSVLDRRDFHPVYQPLYDIRQSRILGYEALTRFISEPVYPPDVWFDAANLVGLQAELEIEALREALRGLDALPPDTYMSLNISARTLFDPALHALLAEHPMDRLVLEVTEHELIEDYVRLNEAFAPLRAKGVRLAIDDVGAGYSSLRHILELDPHIIKLDRSLIQAIDTQPKRLVLAESLVLFASKVGMSVVAEGIERNEELRVLERLKVDKAQGYLLGRPAPLDSLQRS